MASPDRSPHSLSSSSDRDPPMAVSGDAAQLAARETRDGEVLRLALEAIKRAPGYAQQIFSCVGEDRYITPRLKEALARMSERWGAGVEFVDTDHQKWTDILAKSLDLPSCSEFCAILREQIGKAISSLPTVTELNVASDHTEVGRANTELWRKLALIRWVSSFEGRPDVFTSNPELVDRFFEKQLSQGEGDASELHARRRCCFRKLLAREGRTFAGDEPLRVSPVIARAYHGQEAELEVWCALVQLDQEHAQDLHRAAWKLHQDGLDLKKGKFVELFRELNPHAIGIPEDGEGWLRAFLQRPYPPQESISSQLTLDCVKSGEHIDREYNENARKFPEDPLMVSLPIFSRELATITINDQDPKVRSFFEALESCDLISFLVRVREGRHEEEINHHLAELYALFSDTHFRESLHPVLRRTAHAVLAGAAFLNCDDAPLESLLNSPAYADCRDPALLSVSVPVAWRLIQRETIEDDGPSFDGYLLRMVRVVEPFLSNDQTFAPYVEIVHSKPEEDLSEQAREIINGCDDLEVRHSIAVNRREHAQFAKHCRAILKEAAAAALSPNYCECRWSFEGLLRSIVVQEALGAEEIARYLDQILPPRFDKADARDVAEMSLFLAELPFLKDACPRCVDVARSINRLVDAELEGRLGALLRGPDYDLDDFIAFYANHLLELYCRVDRYRESLPPAKVQSFAALVIGSACHLTASLPFLSAGALYTRRCKSEGWPQPPFLPDFSANLPAPSAVATGIFLHEQARGGIDEPGLRMFLESLMFKGFQPNYGVFYLKLDAARELLEGPLGRFLPTDGPGGKTLQEYRFLLRYVDD